MQNTALFGMMGASGGEVMIVVVAALMIPIVTVLAGIGMGAWAVYLSYKKRKEMFTLYHQERMAAIEKGIQLPPLPGEFFQEDGRGARSKPGHDKLLVGLILLFLGLAVFVAMVVSGAGVKAVWSLVFIALGMAFLIYYLAVDRREIKAAQNNLPPPTSH